VELRSAFSIAARPSRATWLLKPYVERGAMVLMVGAEGTYKSFLALDWSLQIAKAGEPVVFLHAEGRGLWKRLRAWCRHRYPGQPWADVLNGVPFLAVERPLNLSADRVLVELTKAIDATGRKPALVVVDTLSRNSDGSVERSNEDANMYLNRLDQGMRARYGATVLLIHHVGHAARDRARGPFTLIANTDANFLLERPDPQSRTVTVRTGRMKDTEPPAPFELQAEIITLDETDEEGNPETSLALRATGREPTPARKAPTGRNQQLLLGAIREHVRSTSNPFVTTADLLAMAKAQGLNRKRLPEARESLGRDGWIAETVGGIKLMEGIS
jgi:KaiC/GvpD/RAD55 family RecA-like ATPase